MVSFRIQVFRCKKDYRFGIPPVTGFDRSMVKNNRNRPKPRSDRTDKFGI